MRGGRGYYGGNRRGGGGSGGGNYHSGNSYGGRVNSNDRNGGRYGGSNYGNGGASQRYHSSSSHYDSRNRDNFAGGSSGRRDALATKRSYSNSARDRSNDRKHSRTDDYRRATAGHGNRTPPSLPPPLVSAESSSSRNYRGSQSTSNYRAGGERNHSSTANHRHRSPPPKRPMRPAGGISRPRGLIGSSSRGGGGGVGGIRTVLRGGLRHNALRRETVDLKIMRRKLFYAKQKDRQRVMRIQQLASSLRRRRNFKRGSKSPVHRRRNDKKTSDGGSTDEEDDEEKKSIKCEDDVKEADNDAEANEQLDENDNDDRENDDREDIDNEANDDENAATGDNEKKSPKKSSKRTAEANASENEEPVEKKNKGGLHGDNDDIGDEDQASAAAGDESSGKLSTNKKGSEDKRGETDDAKSEKDNKGSKTKSSSKDDATKKSDTTVKKEGATKSKNKDEKSATTSSRDKEKSTSKKATKSTTSSSRDEKKHRSDDKGSKNDDKKTDRRDRDKLRSERMLSRREDLRSGLHFIELTCVHCNMKCVTFKEYMKHFSLVRHRAAIRQVANRQREYLMRLRMAQRAAQREIEEKSTEEHEPKYCFICRLNYRQPKAKHQLSEHHKTIKKFLMPYCSTCHLAFKSPMLYEMHRCSLEHVRNKARKHDSDSDHSGDDMRKIDLNKYMTVDSVGEIDDEELGAGIDVDIDLDSSGLNDTIGLDCSDMTIGGGGADDDVGGDRALVGAQYIRRADCFYCSLCSTYSPTNGISIRNFAKKHCLLRVHLKAFLAHKEAEAAKMKTEKAAQNEEEEDDAVGATKAEPLDESLQHEKDQSLENDLSHHNDANNPTNGDEDCNEIKSENNDARPASINDEELWNDDDDKDLDDLLAEVNANSSGVVVCDDEDDEEDESVLNIDIESEKPKPKEMNKEVNGNVEIAEVNKLEVTAAAVLPKTATTPTKTPIKTPTKTPTTAPVKSKPQRKVVVKGLTKANETKDK